MKTRIALALSVLLPFNAHAHVKWFSGYSYNQAPVGFSSLGTPAFWALLVLSIITIGLFVYADRVLEKWPAYVNLNNRLGEYADRAPVILRIFTGASLLLAWQADTMIAPELKIPNQLWGWFQFALALLMLGATTSALAGLGMIILYLFAIYQFGMFHMLDYLVYPAIGYFLFVTCLKNPKVHNTRIPALYVGLGFSLFWAALEKVFYPTWGLEVLHQEPALTMGLNHGFFLLACAFIEMSLGYLLIIGLLQRSLALTITLVFFTTTCFFGKTEVVGHTILHGALLVFIVVGRGYYFRPPIEWHKQVPLKIAFACVNFLIVGALLAWPYHQMATSAFEKRGGQAVQTTIETTAPIEPATGQAPSAPEAHDHDHGHEHSHEGHSH